MIRHVEGCRLRILETVLYAANLDCCASFYQDVLELEVHSRQPGLFVFFRCGDSMLLLFDPTAAASNRTVPSHGAHGQGHVCFAVEEAALDGWERRLIELEVAIEQRVAWPGGGRSIYCRDPADNSVEFASPSIWGLDDSPTPRQDNAAP